MYKLIVGHPRLRTNCSGRLICQTLSILNSMSRFNTLLSLFCTSLLLFLPTSLYSQDATEPEPVKTEEDLSAVKPVRPASALHRSRYPRDDQNHMQVIASFLPEDGLVWVEHYPEPFLAYWQADRSSLPKGALLILHDEGETPLWQNTTRPLHETLPDYGWATFALSLPKSDTKAIPKRSFPVKTKPVIVGAEVEEDSSEEASAEVETQDAAIEQAAPLEPDTKDTSESLVKNVAEDKIPASEIIEQRLESALRFLHDKGQYNIIVLGSGVNAITAQKFIEKITPKIQNPQLQGQLEKPIRALVLVNSRNRLPTMEKEYDKWFSDKELPVLDIYFKQNARNAHDARKRKKIAKVQGVKFYQQVAINELSGERSWGENKLSRRIRSFLDKNASGVEVEGVLMGR